MNRSGILLVDKPDGLSSAAVVAKVKRHLQSDKVGHGGTLDPFATGLLVVLLGEATKIARFLLEGSKSYEATAKLGEETDTGDLQGKITETLPAPKILSLSQWEEISEQYLGKIQQVPPAYAAIKVQGKAAYEYAREGKPIELAAREVEIHDLEILEASDALLRFRVSCGGGTYIRSLARDMARSLGSFAHLTALRRTESNQFSIESAITLDALLASPPESTPLLPIQDALKHLPQVLCSAVEAEKIRQGNLGIFRLIEQRFQAQGYFLLLTENAKQEPRPLAIASAHPQMQDPFKLERVFDRSLLDT